MMMNYMEKMQQVTDAIGDVLNDETAPQPICLAVLRLLHDALLPRLNHGQRSMYDVLVKEAELVLRSKEDEDGDAR